MPKRTLYPGEFMWQLDDNRGAKRRRLERPNEPFSGQFTWRLEDNPGAKRQRLERPNEPLSGQFTWPLDDNRDPNRLAEERNVDIRQRMASIREERRQNDA